MNKLGQMIESDVFVVSDGLHALSVIETRARNWQASPHVSQDDLDSIGDELRLVESALAVGHKYGVTHTDAVEIWAQLHTWCAKPYVSRRELQSLTAALGKKRALLLRTREHLRGEGNKIVSLRRAG